MMMLNDAQRPAQWPRVSVHLWLAISLLATGGASARAEGDAQPAADHSAVDNSAADHSKARVGQLVRVTLPITGSVDTQVKRTIQRALSKMPADGPRRVIILEFAPAQNKFGEGSDFSRAMSLARYVSGRDLTGVKTVAFIPKSIKGHAVLVAMACEEIVMAPESELGEPAIDEPADELIGPAVRSGYFEVADKIRTIVPEVALAMLDKKLEVFKIETETTRVFALASSDSPAQANLQTVDAVRQKQAIQDIAPLFKPGEARSFTGRRARELGFVKYLTADRGTMARTLGLPLEAILEDPSLVEDWRPTLVRIRGPIRADDTARVQKTIEDEIRNHDVNFVCLSIDSPGGSLTDSMTLANFLADLDPSKVRTVAYIAEQARADAALIAIACDQIVMQQDAILGGSGAQAFSPDDIANAKKAIRDNLCPKKSRSWSLPVALIDPTINVHRYTRKGVGPVEFFSQEEAQAQADPDSWQQGDEVTHVGEPLRIKGKQAEEMGVARQLVHDFAGLRELYGIDEKDIRTPEPGWADVLIEALASPMVGWLLLFIGWAALVAELQAPGVGFGGFVAGVSFLLFFWGRHLGGTAGWLEVLLFLAGICCVLLEIFVLPGTGIFGLGGGAMIIFSIILASQTFVVPHNDYQWQKLGDTMLGLAGVSIGIIVAAVVMRRYLPHTPVLSHMLLHPPSGEELEGISHREAMVDFSHLLGAEGTTTTPLLPAGKARFGGQPVDVIADGEFIGRGTNVVVVEVSGNRVVVKSAPGQA